MSVGVRQQKRVVMAISCHVYFEIQAEYICELSRAPLSASIMISTATRESLNVPAFAVEIQARSCSCAGRD